MKPSVSLLHSHTYTVSLLVINPTADSTMAMDVLCLLFSPQSSATHNLSSTSCFNVVPRVTDHIVVFRGLVSRVITAIC